MQKSTQPQGLISVLLNKQAEFGDRDDAAMDLSAFDDAAAESALVSVLTDFDEDLLLMDSAAESLNEIWARAGRGDPALVESFHPGVRGHFSSGS